jgi:hypothetical protein
VNYRPNYVQFAFYAIAASAVNIGTSCWTFFSVVVCLPLGSCTLPSHVSAIYNRVLHFELEDNAIVLALAAVVSTALLIYGYANEARKAFFKCGR